MERKPDPMRAFEGLSVADATKLGNKMGYRVIIAHALPEMGHAEMTKKGEIGLWLDKHGNVDRVDVGYDRPKPPLERTYPPASYPKGMVPRPSVPFYPAGVGLPPFDVRDKSFLPKSYNPYGFYPSPIDCKLTMDKQCWGCKRLVNSNPGAGTTYMICQSCVHNFCENCAQNHKNCKGKTQPSLSPVGG